jgi:hypothetical protein
VTELGVLGAGPLAALDRAGTLAPAGAAWTLGWWVGAEDRWHVPPAEAAVRQTLVGDAPVVETRMRVVGGDVVHRAYAALAVGGAPAVVVEIANETAVPVAVALVVHGEAPPSVEGERLRVGDHEIRLPRPPSTVVGEAVFLPVPHRATLRVVVAEGDAPEATALPEAERVVAGWRRQVEGGMRVVLPDPALQAVVDATRCFLLLHPRPDLLATALVAEAAAVWGHDPGLEDFAARQGLSGAFKDPAESMAATGQALYAIGAARGAELDPDLVGPVAKAAHWIERKRMVRRHRKDARRARLLPAGPQPTVLGAPDQTYADDWWSIAGLARAARLLEGAGQVEAAVDAGRFARGLSDDVDRSVATVTAGEPSFAIPAGPSRPLDAGVVGVLLGLVCGAADPDDPAVMATLDLIRAELTPSGQGVTPGVLGSGWSPWLTALLAAVEAQAGDARAVTRLRAVVAAAGGLGAWPELVDGEPVVDVPLADHHPLATAAVLLATRSLLVVERPPATLAVLPVLPPEWVGQGIEVHDAPTALGTLSWAVRWHGPRPALLWDLSGPPVAGFRLEAPGLDPRWATTEASGEALLEGTT